MENQEEDRHQHPVIICIIAGIAAGIILKLFIVDILHISGTSMEPAVHDHTVVFVNKLAYGLCRPFGSDLLIQWAEPEAGDVVIFLYKDRLVIKRCAATAGTHLEYSSDSGYSLIVGDKIIPLSEAQFHRMGGCTEVPDGTILAVGDNYTESIDSRNYGFVSKRNILGKVLCR